MVLARHCEKNYVTYYDARLLSENADCGAETIGPSPDKGLVTKVLEKLCMSSEQKT